MIPLLVFTVALLLVIFGYVFYAYNRLTQLRNTAEAEWSQIDVELKKRSDLIPAIIEVVKGYAVHEKQALERVSRLRTEAAVGVQVRGDEESDLSKHVAGVLALREAYPDLKANQGFLELQTELFDIEEDIARRRSNYNNIVKAYNDFILKFPGNVISGMIGFSSMELFIFMGSREVPSLDFSSQGGN
ncbi:MAG TPA: LemA family protein [bacterium]|jgi:LemA protein